MRGASGGLDAGAALSFLQRFRSVGGGRAKRLRGLGAALLVAAFAAAAASLAVHEIGFLLYVEHFAEDVRRAMFTPAEPIDRDIVIVTINDDTLQNFPYREPVDRGFIADLVRTLAGYGPRAIGIDILFDQATEPAKDAALRDLLAGLQVPLVVSYVVDPALVTPEQKAFLDDFVPPGARALANLGEDDFDTARYILTGSENADGTFVPSFARALVGKLGITLPEGQVDIAWSGPRPNPVGDDDGHFPIHPAQGFLKPDFFAGKIVLIGADYSITDRHRTPFAAVFEGARGMLPGIVIHAHSVAQLLHGRAPDSLSMPANLAIALLLAGLGAFLGRIDVALLMRVALGGASLVALWGIGFGLFHETRAMIELVTPSLALALALWMSDSLGGREARRQREQIRTTFGRYVSPKVLDLLVERGVSLEGNRRTMTFIFTDVAGFTTLSESLGSRELGEMLNAYLDGVCRVILKHDGMVDKFIGDAVFAIFNAPTDQPDHAERAVRCAIELDQYAERFRAQQNAAGTSFGFTRIGVHSGEATVGNFGSVSTMQFTALGDAVNTASRLEGLNKYFETRICVSDATRALCPGIVFRPVGVVTLKGKTQALAVFEPVDPAMSADYLARYAAAYARLEQGHPAALGLFSELAVERPEDGCVAAHLARLRRGEAGAGIVMTEK